MSLGGGVDDVIDDAVQSAIDAGVIVVVSAGKTHLIVARYTKCVKLM